MKNGRCRLHGGKSRGPKGPAAKTGRKHGIYDAAMTEEELALTASMVLGNVDEELKITRLRLRRALIAQDKWANAPLDEAGMPLVEIVNEVNEKAGEAGGEAAQFLSTKKVQKLPNFDTIIHGLIAHINSLEKTRKELLGETGAGTKTGSDLAREIKDALSEIDDTVPEQEP